MNTVWGENLICDIAPIPIPTVITETLVLCQSELRKPLLMVCVPDVSGSMETDPLAKPESTMRLVPDPQVAPVDLLQPSRRDVTIILPLNHTAEGAPVGPGGTLAALAAAFTRVKTLPADDGSDV